MNKLPVLDCHLINFIHLLLDGFCKSVLPNKASCTSTRIIIMHWTLGHFACAIYKHFSGFEPLRVVLPNIVHARPSARYPAKSIRGLRTPLGGC